jgi:prepilin-type processing-associated H-X9-DG protein
VLLDECNEIFAIVTDPMEGGWQWEGNYGTVHSPVNNNDANIYPFFGQTGGTIMTGCLGGDTNCNPGTGSNPNLAAKTGVHGGVSNFLMADGHVKALRGENVCQGSVAYAQDCNANGSPATSDCPSNSGMAAGTENGSFAATFSPL